MGTIVADVSDATHVPTEGEYVFLKLGGEPDPKKTLFRVVMVAWNTELKTGDGDLPVLAQREVYVLVEPASTQSS